MGKTKDTIWKGLLKEHYKVVKTPGTLANSLKFGSKKGFYFKYGYSVPYKVVKEDKDTWVVDTESINAKGFTAGGHYYVSKKNPSRAMWD